MCILVLSWGVSFIGGGNRSIRRKPSTCQFYWWRKPEYPEKTNDLSQVTGKLYNKMLYRAKKKINQSFWTKNINIVILLGDKHPFQWQKALHFIYWNIIKSIWHQSYLISHDLYGRAILNANVISVFGFSRGVNF